MLIFGKIPDERLNLFNKLWSIDEKVKNDSSISKVLVFGGHWFNYAKRTSILIATVEHITQQNVLVLQNWY